MRIARAKLQTNKIYSKYAGSFEGRYLALFGGGGSGKSVYAIQKFIRRLVNESDGKHKFLFIRKVATTIRETIFDLTKKELEKSGFLQFCEINKTDKTIIFTPNGNKIIFLGVDDSEKLKSLVGVTGVFIEEVTELEEIDFLQINLRLRGETAYYKQIVFAFNPVDTEHWLVKYVEPQFLEKMPDDVVNLNYICENKVWEFDKEAEDDNGKKVYLKTRTLNTTYKDNRFIDADYKNVLRMLGSSSASYADVYERGRWGREKTGDLFAFKFDQHKHVKLVQRDSKNVLHFTVDFNVRPYMSGLVLELQWIEDSLWGNFENFWQLKVINEMSLEYPNNTANDLGQEFNTTYGATEGFFLYGDASGLKNTGIKDTKTHFDDVVKGLGDSAWNVVKRIPTANPRYKNIAPNSLGRKAFLNLLLSGELPCRILINPKCKNLIADLKYCLQDGNGGLLKKKNKDGVEERGHHLDAFQYFICHPETLGYLAKIGT